jgi:hypothetical protein
MAATLKDFEEEQYDMKAPFGEPFQKLCPDELSIDSKRYLVAKLSEFKGTKNKQGKPFSELAFLTLRLVNVFFNPNVNKQFFMSTICHVRYELDNRTVGNWKRRPLGHSSTKGIEVDPKRVGQPPVLSAASAAKYMASRTSDSTVEANKSSSSSSSMANMYEQLDGMDWTFIQLYVLERMQKEIKEKKKEEEEEEKKEEEEDAVLVAPKRKSKHYPHSCFLHLILLMPCCRGNSPSKHKTNNTR